MEENKVPSELLAKWLAQYMDTPKIQTTIGGIEAEDGNSQTSCWLLFKRPDGVDVQIQLAARPSQPYSSIVAKIFEGHSDEMAYQVGRWVDEQTGGAPRKHSSGTTTVHPVPQVSDRSTKTDTKATVPSAPIAVRGAPVLPPRGNSKRIRVVATNGQKTVDLFFVRRRNDDLYYGETRDAQKYSYHASGKRHMTGKRGVKRQEYLHTPLSMIEGYFHLTTAGYKIHSILDNAPADRFYTGRRSDIMVYLDTRSIPRGAIVNLSIGILEAGRLDKLPLIEDSTMRDQQVSLFTGMKPWVCVRVAWRP